MNAVSLDMRRKLRSLKQGERFMYFKGETGHLPPALSRAVRRTIDDGLITVVHRKVQDGYRGVYEYWAVGL